jgi:hydroxymethylglutaryl-CoA lyase
VRVVKEILVHEVGLRDGLQIEERIAPTERKLEWIARLAAAGIDMIQVGSFVSPRKMPQMADTDVLFQRLTAGSTELRGVRRPVFSALVLNEPGLERGLACGVEYFCMGVSASDTHSRKNTGMSTVEAMQRIVGMGHRVLENGKGLQVSVQSAFGCGFEGVVPQQRVLDLAQIFVDAGFVNLSLADTAGHASPTQVEDLFGALYDRAPHVHFACHFHDTYGLGMANVYAALRAGVTSFESAVGGLGGCPFTALAAGNVCTEDLVHLLQLMDLRHDIRLGMLVDLARDAAAFFERALPGRIHATGPISRVGSSDGEVLRKGA